MSIIEKVVKERQRLGLGQIHFAELLGVSRRVITDFEKASKESFADDKSIQNSTKKLLENYFSSLVLVPNDTVETIQAFQKNKQLNNKDLSIFFNIPNSIIKLYESGETIPQTYFQQIQQKLIAENVIKEEIIASSIIPQTESAFVEYLKQELEKEKKKVEELNSELARAREFIAQHQGIEKFDQTK